MTAYFCECFICGSLQAECGHREAELQAHSKKVLSQRAQDQPDAADEPAEVVTMPDRAKMRLNARKREIRLAAEEFRQRRGWQ